VAQINAGRLIAEAGCDCVKLEGGRKMAQRVRAIADAGIAVMGHIGLTPQSLSAAGGYRVYGKTRAEFESILDDALALEDAGASFVLLEAIPEEPAGLVRDALKVPVYGIGAGRHVDGQLLILHDMIGAFVGDVAPKFAKRYANVGQVITDALSAYVRDVKAGAFPADEHLYPIDAQEAEKIRASVAERRR
jgi:3-methyl-2-oxobutanoate hydroxymethyltransferase